MRKVAFIAVMLLALGAGYSVQAEEAKPAAQTVTGEAACAKCAYSAETKVTSCGSAIKVGDKVYLVKAAEGSSDEVKTAVSKKEFKGKVTVTGTIAKDAEGKEWLLAEKVEK